MKTKKIIVKFRVLVRFSDNINILKEGDEYIISVDGSLYNPALAFTDTKTQSIVVTKYEKVFSCTDVKIISNRVNSGFSELEYSCVSIVPFFEKITGDSETRYIEISANGNKRTLAITPILIGVEYTESLVLKTVSKIKTTVDVSQGFFSDKTQDTPDMRLIKIGSIQRKKAKIQEVKKPSKPDDVQKIVESQKQEPTVEPEKIDLNNPLSESQTEIPTNESKIL